MMKDVYKLLCTQSIWIVISFYTNMCKDIRNCGQNDNNAAAARLPHPTRRWSINMKWSSKPLFTPIYKKNRSIPVRPVVTNEHISVATNIACRSASYCIMAATCIDMLHRVYYRDSLERPCAVFFLYNKN